MVSRNSEQNRWIRIASRSILQGAAVLVFALYSFLTPQNFVSAEAAAGATYFVSTTGLDTNPGTLSKPWLTVEKAVNTVVAGDTVYVRGGEYAGIKNGWAFQNSGTQLQPITLSNYPGEQAVLEYP
jgi:hypothetical protein